MLTCKEIAEFLMDYLDGELPVEQAESFRKHLELCPPCGHYLETYERTMVLSKAAFEEDCKDGASPGAVPEELIQAILAARKKSDG